jgi:hypothetical protein
VPCVTILLERTVGAGMRTVGIPLTYKTGKVNHDAAQDCSRLRRALQGIVEGIYQSIQKSIRLWAK